MKRSGKLDALVRAARPLARSLKARYARRNKLDQYYQKWIQQNSGNKALEPWKDIKFSVRTVFFSLLIDCDDTSIDHLDPTLRSIEAQTFPFWELHLVSRSPITRERLRRKIRGLKRFHVTTSRSPRLHGTHVAYLTAGDVLDKDTLYVVSRALVSKPDLDVVYTDEDRLDRRGQRHDPWLKPGWSPELLFSQNYINRFCAVRIETAKKCGGVNLHEGCASDFDLLLRLGTKNVRAHRCAFVGCHVMDTRFRAAINRAREKRESKLLVRHLGPRSAVKVTKGFCPHTRLVRFSIKGKPLVSIIIPFKDKPELLQRCVGSIIERTKYPHYEILLVSNNSELKATAELVERLNQHKRVRPLKHDVPFNYSEINNWAARSALGNYLLFLNNDIEVQNGGWMNFMLEYAQRPESGAVGAKLLFPNGAIQHAGVIVGMSGMASHIFSRQKENDCYRNQASVVRNYLAVTAACMLLQKDKFWRAGGFDESFILCGSDVALCLRLASLGFRNVYHPAAVLYHHEKATRGTKIPPGDYTASFRHYQQFLEHGDPFYNPNLSLNSKDCSLRFEREDFYPELKRRYGQNSD
jgi:GT2 family glycosyltransferase